MEATEQVTHTPGPWTIEREADRLLIRNRVGYCGDLLVGGPNPDANAQNEANALLIAAAPDMLEALREIIACADTLDRPVDMLGNIGLVAREAIAKAEGSAD